MIKNAKVYGKFYSPEKVLSYGRPWMFVLGTRSIGKSTGIGMFVLMQYLKKGEKFLYIRRDQDEIMETCRTFFMSPVEILKNNGYDIAEFKYDRGNYFIRRNDSDVWEQCGTILPLSKQGKAKSANYSEYFWGIYDEFIPDDNTKYLGNGKNFYKQEYKSMISLYQTVDRGVGKAYRNEFRVFFLGNKATYNNPIFRQLGIIHYVNNNSKFIAPKDVAWIVEQVDTVEALKDIQKSWAYQLSDDSYKNYAFRNRAFDDNDAFIRKIDSPSQPLGNVIYCGHKMGIYMFSDKGYLYVSDKVNSLGTFALTTEDHNEINYVLLQSANKSFMMKTMLECYMNGQLYFENVRCKNDICAFYALTE